jgi:hypothetical protein
MLTLIQKTVLSSNQSEIVFSNIPQNYNSLYILGSMKSTRSSAQGDFSLKPNGSTSGYSARRLSQYTGSVASDGAAHVNFAGSNIDTNMFSTIEIHVSNYNKATLKTFNIRTSYRDIGSYAAGLWNSTSALTSLTLYDLSDTNGNQMRSGTSIYLYGVK